MTEEQKKTREHKAESREEIKRTNSEKRVSDGAVGKIGLWAKG